MRLLAAALLALTTVLVGFAHRPTAIETQGDPADASAWILPDGTLPDLCHVDDPGGRPHGSDPARAPCDACRLADAPGLAATVEFALPAPSAIPLARLGRSTAALAGSLLPAPTSRGPPRLG